MWSQRDPSIRKTGVGNIFIKNLDTSLGHKELYDHFSEYGSILSCKVALSETGQSKGYGFVHYESEKAAQAAIEKVNNTKFAGKEVYAFLFSYFVFVSYCFEEVYTFLFTCLFIGLVWFGLVWFGLVLFFALCLCAFSNLLLVLLLVTLVCSSRASSACKPSSSRGPMST
jgi:hypothetical protein